MNKNNNYYPSANKKKKIIKYSKWSRVLPISSILESAKRYYNFTIDLENPDRYFYLTIAITCELSYKIFLFELIKDHENKSILKLVMYRDIILRQYYDPTIIFNTKMKKHEMLYEYSGTWLSVNPDYRQQDISLFSYYVYAMILEHIEKIYTFNNIKKVGLTANNASTVSYETNHTKCPYCPYFHPAFELDPVNNGSTESTKNVEMYLLNPNKRIARNDSVSEVTIDGKKYQKKNTQYHFYMPVINGPFLKKVTEIYNSKKQKDTLGVKLIKKCLNSTFRGTLSNWLEKATLKNRIESSYNISRHRSVSRPKSVSGPKSVNAKILYEKNIISRLMNNQYLDNNFNIRQSVTKLSNTFQTIYYDFYIENEKKNETGKRARIERKISDTFLQFDVTMSDNLIKIKIIAIIGNDIKTNTICFFIAYLLSKQILGNVRVLLISYENLDKLLLSDNTLNQSDTPVGINIEESTVLNIYSDEIQKNDNVKKIKWWTTDNNPNVNIEYFRKRFPNIKFSPIQANS